MERNEVLKPCPFCGTSDHLFIEPDERGSGGQWVSPIHAGCSQLTGCGVSRTGDDIAEAVAAWNTRTSVTNEEVVSVLKAARSQIALFRSPVQGPTLVEKSIDDLLTRLQSKRGEATSHEPVTGNSVADLRAENERLREVLREYLHDYGDNEDADSQRMAAKARAALSEQEGK